MAAMRNYSKFLKGVLGSTSRTVSDMFRFAKAALNLTGQSARQVAVRHASDVSPEFHAKYGYPLIAAGTVFCIAVWGYVLTSTGITWNLSPVGKVQPKPWREE